MKHFISIAQTSDAELQHVFDVSFGLRDERQKGKPHDPIYRLALARTTLLRGKPVPPTRVLAIGDGPDTDIAGANEQGFATLFVAGGIHQGEIIANGALDAAAVEKLLAEKGRRADYAMAALSW